MKTYQVIVTRDTTESTLVTVEAENAEEAEQAAIDQSYNPACVWAQDDTPNASSDHYTNGVEEDDQ